MISYDEYERQYSDAIKIMPQYEEAFRKYHEAILYWIKEKMTVPRSDKILKVDAAYAYPIVSSAFKASPSYVPEGQDVKGVKQKLLDLKENRTDIPIMTFFMTGMSADPSRRLPKHVRFHLQDHDESKKYSQAGFKDLPFNLIYQFSAWTKLKSDMAYLEQQFLIDFSPLKYFEVDTQQIPMTLDSIADASILESSQGTQQLIRYEFTCTMQAWLKTPITQIPTVRKEIFVFGENIADELLRITNSYNVRTGENRDEERRRKLRDDQ